MIKDHMTLWVDLFIVSQYPAKFGCLKYCGSEDVMFLICQLTSRDHMIFSQYCIPYRNQTFGKQCQSNYWFVHGIHHWDEMG